MTKKRGIGPLPEGSALWKSTLLTDKAIRKQQITERDIRDLSDAIKREADRRMYARVAPSPMFDPANATHDVKCSRCRRVTRFTRQYLTQTRVAYCHWCGYVVGTSSNTEPRPLEVPLSKRICTLADECRKELDRHIPEGERLLMDGDVEASRKAIHDIRKASPHSDPKHYNHLVWVNRHLELMEKWPVIGFKESETEAPTSRRPGRSEVLAPALA